MVLTKDEFDSMNKEQLKEYCGEVVMHFDYVKWYDVYYEGSYENIKIQTRGNCEDREYFSTECLIESHWVDYVFSLTF